MSKEQKHLKPCHILDRLREWFELYGNQNHQRAEEELHLAIDELYEYQQKDKQLADTETQNKRVLEKLELIVRANQELEQKLAESKNSLKRTIEHYEKYCSEINHQNVMLYASACNSQQASRDKIPFCIEQLSTLRNFVNSKAIFSKNECECEVCKDISQTIANRIKRLEEGE